MSYNDRIAKELDRLKHGVKRGAHSDGFVISYDIACHGNAGIVLARTKNVMVIINEHCVDCPPPTREEWIAVLPSWFVSQCAPELTPEQKQEYIEWWDHATDAEKLRYGRIPHRWSLNNFTYWFMDEGLRTWFWWEARITGPDTFLLSIEVDGHPFAMGALEWLLHAAGATSITEHIRAWGENE